ncbi:ATP-dependent DNA helicase pif1 isoform X1 [Triticum aestivum]|uniref:ATP-dependent DNA helicase pif1 isoform X1 n=1 Tax=Triticum aestivum TaxID=4565 RepID=UPI0008443788|nr:ATP-dependent DNA helicase pif1-like isoform X1 [Triticum aestivum]XP_044396294.1 ATP-dependent DNA helicase pif1-like isoform X1 [Triticum aestivum]XP_044396302.1 ATP-dependent DNA helicase pif1-like isoform X1 [Triticum aestivum]XP_044396311.1 ATP-dependent DNA helicase pif1-like isoform X1 [Triticum aestivum]XP_044396316.1 ATP-dependent DNA helicase pif1-like isoform X1 [Triticum aestivum]XP_044396321.1 ATP-dependent DNA helicase pif1-like isoform X1 [Triticum aestivum]XP_044396327.1 AT
MHINTTLLADVISIASYIGHIEETQTTHGISKIRDIVLQIEDQKISIRLWGNKVGQIDEDSLGRVVIVTSTTVRKLKEYSLSSTGATRVYIDLDIPETNELQTRYGGTGKTFLWKAITTKLRSEGKIVIAVASSDIAALLLQGGRPAHSRFHIPLKITNESTCNIKQGTFLAELIKKTSLIIWDEPPMTHKHCFEALDKSLGDILRFTYEDAEHRPFGGMTVVLGGDFRQILPVIPKGKIEHIISASIKSSYLWKNFEEYRLKENMRLNSSEGSPEEKAKTAEFANWKLNIGDGTTSTIDEVDWVSILEDLILHKGDDPEASIVNTTYPDLHRKYTDRTYLEERAILCPRNETADQITAYIMSQIRGEEVTYFSSDTTCKAMSTVEDEDMLYPTEFLNSTFSGIPDHELRLKVGLPIMLMRNINQSAGLCNGQD